MYLYVDACHRILMFCALIHLNFTCVLCPHANMHASSICILTLPAGPEVYTAESCNTRFNWACASSSVGGISCHTVYLFVQQFLIHLSCTGCVCVHRILFARKSMRLSILGVGDFAVFYSLYTRIFGLRFAQPRFLRSTFWPRFHNSQNYQRSQLEQKHIGALGPASCTGFRRPSCWDSHFIRSAIFGKKRPGELKINQN